MTAFRYRAVDPAGKETAGVLEADTGKAARGLLRERGLFPLEVASVAQDGGGNKALSPAKPSVGSTMTCLPASLKFSCSSRASLLCSSKSRSRSCSRRVHNAKYGEPG